MGTQWRHARGTQKTSCFAIANGILLDPGIPKIEPTVPLSISRRLSRNKGEDLVQKYNSRRDEMYNTSRTIFPGEILYNSN